MPSTADQRDNRVARPKLAASALALAAVVLAAMALWWALQNAQARAHWLAARDALDAYDSERAHDELTPCLAWWPGRRDVRLLAARSARLAKRYDDAEALLSRLEADGAVDDALRVERALLQVQQGDLADHHLLLLPQGLQAPDVPVEVLEAVAHGYAATFYTDEAQRVLARILQREPAHPRAHLLAATLLMRVLSFEAALRHLEAAVQVLPASKAPRLKLVDCLVGLGRVADADVHLDLLRQRFPDDPEVALAQARSLDYHGQAADASAVLELILQAHPEHTALLTELGRLRYRQGELASAMAVLEQAVRLPPAQPEPWDTLAYCHAALGAPADAARCKAERDRLRRDLGEITRRLALVTQDRPDDLDLRLELADRYEQLGHWSEAVRWWFCVLQREPAQADRCYRALAALYQRSGQPHLAARYRTRVEP